MSVRTYSFSFIDDVAMSAQKTPRRRLHANLHASYQDPVQRLFNAIGTDSYIRPHRHLGARADEFLMAVRGVFTLVLFDDHGEVLECRRFGSDAHSSDAEFLAVEIEAGTWHTVLAEEPGSVLFEVKAGPFDPNHAKSFAEWAPAEGGDAALAYLNELRRIVGAHLACAE